MVVDSEIAERPLPPIVFLGPSLPQIVAASLLDAEFRPPIRRGDLAAVGAERLVVIIDGEFDQSFSVSLNEILRLLDAGGSVIGATSMGALRAAELASEGMVGLGVIYEAYRSGQIEGDDEVALTYCPLSFEPRTVPLVNVRFWLDRLYANGCISSIERSALLRRVRRIFYAERTPARLDFFIEASLGAARTAAIRAAGLGEISDVKSEDTRVVLSIVARMTGASPSQIARTPWT
jgi:TfuA protein